MSVIYVFNICWAIAFTSCSFYCIVLFTFLVNAVIVAVTIKNFLKCIDIGKLPITVVMQKKLISF